MKKSLGLLFTNFIICVGFGHGIGPMFLLEFFAMYEFFLSLSAFEEPLLHSFNWNNSYENMIIYFVLISLLGQVLFSISLFKLSSLNKKILRFLGIIIMLFGFFLITKDIFKNGLAVFSFVTGIPFLCFILIELKPLLTFKVPNRNNAD